MRITFDKLFMFFSRPAARGILRILIWTGMILRFSELTLSQILPQIQLFPSCQSLFTKLALSTLIQLLLLRMRLGPSQPHGLLLIYLLWAVGRVIFWIHFSETYQPLTQTIRHILGYSFIPCHFFLLISIAFTNYKFTWHFVMSQVFV